ncbi:hypothetical protein [Levilactobacillus zymae]|jgi:hypothetical protein|uniref:Uncharacterized protein n=1 Tax=Levilactobacillus zymae TaxID=267363 RepID=A0A1Y6JYL5_9LACO|nr:hypothetical protein [Levilactobacillus zymae]KRL11219.1 hypothetical protein FD38_GL001731 [Levilactobacillus zymae DSM 19395]GEO71448.1 hypothetical protein LZY01_06160 [Levilactobacillus zymae]SMS14890.1 hypothetical protein LZ3411_1840 [Levilactobacillus zymae]
MNLQRVITGLGIAIVMLAVVSGLSWFMMGKGFTPQSQIHSRPNHPPYARVTPQSPAD